MKGLKVSRWLVLLSYFGLLSLLLLWFTLLAPPRQIPISLALLVFVGPLLLPLRGLLYQRSYTHAWTAFLVLIYFIHGVVEAWANSAERYLAGLEILLSMTLFTACILYIRYKTRANQSEELTNKGNG